MFERYSRNLPFNYLLIKTKLTNPQKSNCYPHQNYIVYISLDSPKNKQNGKREREREIALKVVQSDPGKRKNNQLHVMRDEHEISGGQEFCFFLVYGTLYITQHACVTAKASSLMHSALWLTYPFFFNALYMTCIHGVPDVNYQVLGGWYCPWKSHSETQQCSISCLLIQSVLITVLSRPPYWIYTLLNSAQNVFFNHLNHLSIVT